MEDFGPRDDGVLGDEAHVRATAKVLT